MTAKEKHREDMKTWRKNNPKKIIIKAMEETMRRKGIDQPDPVVMTDRLLETIHIKLPQDQMDYLRDNQKMNRYELYKAFKKHFKRNINNLQFNFNLMKVKEEKSDGKNPKAVKRYE